MIFLHEIFYGNININEKGLRKRELVEILGAESGRRVLTSIKIVKEKYDKLRYEV